MSDAQFKEFYWPYLRKGLLALIDKGIIPVIYWEADWESRLEHIVDIPEGKIIYHLSNTNFERAWDVLGGKVCLMGNVPNVMLLGGTPDDVKAYCKKIIDYTKGKPGLDHGRRDHAGRSEARKPEGDVRLHARIRRAIANDNSTARIAQDSAEFAQLVAPSLRCYVGQSEEGELTWRLKSDVSH